ncbi:hypothetical protein FHT80_005805 [Rhizobium sp. BK226]|nr:hypothetical protein [Rhizobium sp. BK226]
MGSDLIAIWEIAASPIVISRSNLTFAKWETRFDMVR